VRQVLTQQAVGVFVRATLPWALRVTEVHQDIRRNRERTMRREFPGAFPREMIIPSSTDHTGCPLGCHPTNDRPSKKSVQPAARSAGVSELAALLPATTASKKPRVERFVPVEKS
jgi:hypothetical protein